MIILQGSRNRLKRHRPTLDLTGLPSGFGFQVEVKMTDTTSNQSKPLFNSWPLSFN
ncbi:MAG: hypothetical protein CM15mP130_0030 [Verrucomicrobiota bacterium]|nr:MAG: hypothetical protein CM15mP130_0030 [Verrucomicrobiota bacterium]